MTDETRAALEDVEARARQAVDDFNQLGWPDQASVVDGLLDRLLSAAYELDGHLAGLGLSDDD
jgi:hypothetical protein